MADYQSVLTFWFDTLTAEQWFAKDVQLDREITDKFAGLHAQAVACELADWRYQSDSPAHGRLAEIIVLDQFSRNIHRDTPAAFAQDALALALAQEAVAQGLDAELSATEKAFLYLPYMHSESAAIHQQALVLFRQPGLESNYEFELKHKVIIDRFGRYPHRNAILGRQSTVEEVEFLKQPGSGF